MEGRGTMQFEMDAVTQIVSNVSTIPHLDLKSWDSTLDSVDSFVAIWPTLLGFILGRLLCGHLPPKSMLRFVLEFPLVALPSVVLSTVGSSFIYTYALLVSLVVLGFLHGKQRPAAKSHIYVTGKRPAVLSLLRATAYNGTCVAILAVDFPFYIASYRKSRTFGASAMDMGIGLFVVNMGLVSHKTSCRSELKKLPKSVGALLVLGLARTVVITLIDYHQDEFEYGKHLNAFFILGLTKLMGSLYCLLVRTERQLLGLALGILFLHELFLQLGLVGFVMSTAPHEGFLIANREGLSSLHGCVALYLLSICLAQWYNATDNLNYQQLIGKLKKLLSMALACWGLVFASAYVTGIARVTFNFGYVAWISAIQISLILIYAYVFELKLANSDAPAPKAIGDAADRASASESLPTFVKSLSLNGLTHFMLSNVLTGLVNMALDPAQRSGSECVSILCVYMFVSTGVVFIMFRNRIRIA